LKGLIDTHVLLFALADSKRLSRAASTFLRNRDNELFVSVVSFWELSLKLSLNGFKLVGISPDEVPRYALSLGFGVLPLTIEVASTFHRLPRIGEHRDPFDRMVVWQAIRENMVLVSRDRAMSAYQTCGLSLLW
jgi:PIN domain nuclease of toxin-antitoxin system